jgi:uncharacterized SAM-binding protein YcdF (DUF218 family)
MLRSLLRWFRAAAAVFGALVLLVTVAPPRWYPRLLAGPWNDPTGPTLIVLGGDSNDGILGETSYWRSVFTLLAWREGGVKQIVLSGDLGITGPMRDFLVSGGIPVQAIVIEGRSRSTRENALFTADLARNLPGPYVLLTSDYHMWRASRAFAKAGLAVRPRPFPEALKLFNDWRRRWTIFLELLEETGKIAYYWARGWI